MFNQPVTLLPHQRRGLYCHSSLPDDLGIQYQSYQSKDTVVAENEVSCTTFLPSLKYYPNDVKRSFVSLPFYTKNHTHIPYLLFLHLSIYTHLFLTTSISPSVTASQHITLLAGLGHTGFQPFDERHGWYRAWRGLSGSVGYRYKTLHC